MFLQLKTVDININKNHTIILMMNNMSVLGRMNSSMMLQMYRTSQAATFTRTVRKIVLRKDVPNLGFAGEICFVKPGYALNALVPQKKAYFYTDSAVENFKVDPVELLRKQNIRSMQIFLDKLKDIKLVFLRDVSEINKNVAKDPVFGPEILDSLNKRYGLGIKRQDFRMEHSLDSIGEHFVPVTYQSEVHNKDF